MKIRSIKTMTEYIVKLDDGREFTRSENGGWWESMGSSCEEAFDDGTLEKLFQEYIKTTKPNPIRIKSQSDFRKGMKVHYFTKNLEGAENGIIKELSGDGIGVYVVFKCGGDWDNYENYTASYCVPVSLHEGWFESAKNV